MLWELLTKRTDNSGPERMHTTIHKIKKKKKHVLNTSSGTKMIGGRRRERGRENECGGQKASCLRDKFKKHDLLNAETGGD